MGQRSFHALCSTVLCAVVLGGCPDNSILEAEICLPPKDLDTAAVRIVARRITATTNFETGASSPWTGTDEDRVPLLEGADTTRTLSMVSTKESSDVAVRITYCQNTNCAGELLSGREARFVIEKPFVIGERPSVVLDARPVPVGIGAPVRYTCSGSRCVPESGRAPSCSDAPRDAALPDDEPEADAAVE